MDQQAHLVTPRRPPRLRDAARAVVLDPDRRVLLVRFELPERSLWACPGGGVEPGETHEDAIRRELHEEVGLELRELGPCIWTRTHLLPMFGGRWDGQVERFYLVETDAFEPAPRLTVEQLRAEFVTDLRWWTADELDVSSEIHAPRALPALVRSLLADGPPPTPIDVGI
jgi:8-oxo-dGTP diphosphatase